MAPTTGEVLDGRYRIVGQIGRGGTSDVYLAENIRLGTRWVLKAVDRPLAPGMDLMAEPNMLKRLNHPHLPRIVDVFRVGPTLILVMDYVEGQTLSQLIAAHGPQPGEQALRWGIQLCDLLAYLHGQEPNPIIYRDMKPENVMIDPAGHVRVVDFGIAREARGDRSRDTVQLGTRGYAAPEQYGEGGGPSGPRADIYGLGMTLYFVVTGQVPPAAPDEFHAGLKAARVAPGLAAVLLRATRPAPAERFGSAEELRQALELAARPSLPPGAHPPALAAAHATPPAAPHAAAQGPAYAAPRAAARSDPAPAGAPPIVAFWSPRSGCGQTTLICHLAASAALSGLRVVTADLDLYGGNLALRAGVDPQGGRHDGLVPGPVAGWDLAVPAQAGRAAAAAEALMARLATAYDLVLLDTSPRLSDPATERALHTASALIWLVTPDRAGLNAAAAALPALTGGGRLMDRASLVLCPFAPAWHQPADQVAEWLGAAPVAAVPFLPSDLGKADRAGRLLPRTGRAGEYWQAVDRVLAACGWAPERRPWWRQLLGR